MGTKRKRRPIAPLGSLFQDAMPAEQLDIPDWMKLPPGHGQFSSAPPASAASLLHDEITTTRAKSANDDQAADESPDSIYPPLPPRPTPSNDVGSERRIRTARSRNESRDDAPYSAPPPSARALDGRAQPRDQTPRYKTGHHPAYLQESWPPSSNAPPLGSALLSQPGPAEQALDGLRTAIVELEQSKARSLEKLIPDLTYLVRSICERVLEKEALHDAELPLRLVRDAVARLDHSGHVTILLGRAFEASVLKLQMGLEHEGIQAHVMLVPHRSPYTCEVKADWGALDASLEHRLDEALEKYLERD